VLLRKPIAALTRVVCMEEIELVGGVNRVIRRGATVSRPTGPWTSAVHRLLDHLAAQGFTGAPRVLGTSPDGSTETLTYLDGEVLDYPLPTYARSDAALRSAAQLLRRFHDATTGFVAAPGDAWQLPAREPAEVICHGDAATYNCVFRNGLPVALIDFDTAHPGPRLWDAAYTAYRFVPLHAADADEGTLPLPEQARRLALFAAAYGFDETELGRLPAMVADRLQALVDFMTARAAEGHPAFTQHLAEGHHQRYLADADYVTSHADALGAGTSQSRP